MRKHFHPGNEPSDELFIVNTDGTGLKKIFGGTSVGFSVTDDGIRIVSGAGSSFADGTIHALTVPCL